MGHYVPIFELAHAVLYLCHKVLVDHDASGLIRNPNGLSLSILILGSVCVSYATLGSRLSLLSRVSS